MSKEFKLDLAIRQHITNLNVLREINIIKENHSVIAFLDQMIYNLSEALRLSRLPSTRRKKK